MNYQTALSQVYAAIKPLIGEGVVASYIPELAKVLPNQQFPEVQLKATQSA